MAESLDTLIARKLKPGYKIDIWDNNYFCVVRIVDKSKYVMHDGNRPIIFRAESVDDSQHFRDNLLASLRRAGAIVERTRSSNPHRRAAKRVHHNEPKNSLIIAQETLRDTKATPRERALARNYIELLHSHQSVRELAKRLGVRLKELEKLID